MSAWIIVSGNPVSGLHFHGPFASEQEAEDWGELHAPQDEFWVAPLGTPLQPRANVVRLIPRVEESRDGS